MAQEPQKEPPPPATSPSPQNSAPPEGARTLQGVIHRITYSSPKNGYKVLKLKPIDAKKGWEGCDVGAFTGKVATVTVSDPSLAAGQVVCFWGEWERHQQYGLQFSASGCAPVITQGGDALVHYLLALNIQLVGPATAKCVLRFYGGCVVVVVKSACAFVCVNFCILFVFAHENMRMLPPNPPSACPLFCCISSPGTAAPTCPPTRSIVKHLGPDTVALLDGPDALEALVKVPRLGKARAATIKADWDAKKGAPFFWSVSVATC